MMERIAPSGRPGVSISGDEAAPGRATARANPRRDQLGGRRTGRPPMRSATAGQRRGLRSEPGSAAAASVATRHQSRRRVPNPGATRSRGTHQCSSYTRRAPACLHSLARGAVARRQVALGGPTARVQKRRPSSFRNASSSGVDARPSHSLRCGSGRSAG